MMPTRPTLRVYSNLKEGQTQTKERPTNAPLLTPKIAGRPTALGGTPTPSLKNDPEANNRKNKL